MTTVPIQDVLFDGGPPIGLQKSLRLIRSPTERRVGQRILAAVALGWLPLVVIAAVEFLRGDSTARSLLGDVAVHARFLIAVPLLILAEGDAIPKFDRIVRHFVLSGLVKEQDRTRYDDAIASTRRLLESPIAESLTFFLSYLLVMLLIYNINHADTASWLWSDSGLLLGLSPIGLWHAFVSLPLLVVLYCGWLWRLILWSRFLWLMARLDLHTFPAHPDLAGGLKFVSTSLKGYRLLALATGTVVAGTQMNFILRHSAFPLEFKEIATGVVAFVLIMAAGPLVVFTSKLRETRRRGIFKYGALVRNIGAQFEKQWIDQRRSMDSSTLDTNQFSAMTDINQVVGRAYQVHDLPFILKDLVELVAFAVIPFIPVALMVLPFGEILKHLEKLLL